MENNNHLVCDFCNKQFVREKNFLKHKCETMKRYELFDTVDGQFAFIAFNAWRRMKKYHSVSVDIFANSRYFKAFIEFAEYSRARSIPDRIGYIKLMADKDLQPFYWCDYDVYDTFIKTYDESYPLDKKLEVSIDSLKEMAERYECSVSDIFGHIPPTDLIKLVVSRRMSPWLLLTSQKFKSFMKYNTTGEERMLFNSVIDVPKWRNDFEKNPDIVQMLRELTSKLGI